MSNEISESHEVSYNFKYVTTRIRISLDILANLNPKIKELVEKCRNTYKELEETKERIKEKLKSLFGGKIDIDKKELTNIVVNSRLKVSLDNGLFKFEIDCGLIRDFCNDIEFDVRKFKNLRDEIIELKDKLEELISEILGKEIVLELKVKELSKT